MTDDEDSPWQVVVAAAYTLGPALAAIAIVAVLVYLRS